MKIGGNSVEVIELFEDHLLVQEVLSKRIYLVYYYELDPGNEMVYNNIDSNILSMSYWKDFLCQKKRKKELQKKSYRIKKT